ncbi:MAG: hypothetical protein JSR56_08905 [Proteobacteria bacterium]|nr:hypothetical protein [Pseudomonadota bacterium]
MSRTQKSDEIRDAFLGELRAQGASVESLANLAAKGESAAIRNVFAVLGTSGREVYLVGGIGFINVHVRSDPPGWWNVMKSVKSQFDHIFKNLGVKTYYVFLVPRKDHQITGYIATDFVSPPFINVPSGEETKFTIKVADHLNPLKCIVSVGKIARALLQSPEENTNAL